MTQSFTQKTQNIPPKLISTAIKQDINQHTKIYSILIHHNEPTKKEIRKKTFAIASIKKYLGINLTMEMKTPL